MIDDPISTVAVKRAAKWLFRVLMGPIFLMLLLPPSLRSQSVPLFVTQNNGGVVISWASGLDLVQPQSNTNLSVGSWMDAGSPTRADRIVQDMDPGARYYRLRFLPPTITVQPMGATNVAGGGLTLEAVASGTAPMAYQWYKGDLPIPGKNSAMLLLENLTEADAGNYSLGITNRAGRVTSQVAVVRVSVPPAVPAGIFMGKFSGQADNGGFASLVRTDGSAVAVGYNTPQEEGLFIGGFVVSAKGAFDARTAQSGKATGTFTTAGVTGNFVSSTGNSGVFSGERKPTEGIHSKNAGYYVGTYDGLFQGSAHAILAADGSLFFYTIDNPASPTADGDGGGFGMVNAANSLSGTTVPNGLEVTGTLNPTTAVISGSYQAGGTTLGNFTLTRKWGL